MYQNDSKRLDNSLSVSLSYLHCQVFSIGKSTRVCYMTQSLSLLDNPFIFSKDDS